MRVLHSIRSQDLSPSGGLGYVLDGELGTVADSLVLQQPVVVRPPNCMKRMNRLGLGKGSGGLGVMFWTVFLGVVKVRNRGWLFF